MPRNTRNFWITADVDGRKGEIATGPRSKDGGFSLTVAMRSEGKITRPLTITGEVRGGYLLVLTARYRQDGDRAETVLIEHQTLRDSETKTTKT